MLSRESKTSIESEMIASLSKDRRLLAALIKLCVCLRFNLANNAQTKHTQVQTEREKESNLKLNKHTHTNEAQSAAFKVRVLVQQVDC